MPKNSPRRRKRSKRPRQTKMILTNCAACAAPLARLAKQCSEEDLRRQGHTLDQGHYDSVTGYYRPGEDEEARTPRAAWSAAQTL